MKPISETAFYCCGARMLDAQSKNPIANDYLAKKFMQAEGAQVFHRFKNEWLANAACVVRHKIIDEGIKEFLTTHPNGTIILIGAGFDTRAFRHNGGHWFEIDEHQLITYKNSLLPVHECHNALTRLTVDFSTQELQEQLETIQNNQHILFVIEGVFMYLNTDHTLELLNTLTQTFPQHDILCDLLTKPFQQLFGRSIQRKIEAMGNQFIIKKSPELLFTDHNYTCKKYTSIVATTIQWQAIPAPKFLARFMPTLIEKGYGIYHFYTR